MGENKMRKAEFNIVICERKPEAIEFFKERLGSPNYNILFIEEPEGLSFNRLKDINPRWVFFTHWSWIVPKIICDSFTCVGFHAADLPKFKGGSPLQNQIMRGVKKTKVCAFVLTEKVDDGAIYLREDLSLDGPLWKIWEQISITESLLICKMLVDPPKPVKQEGEETVFKRLLTRDSELTLGDWTGPSLEKLYDRIRMVDHNLYPRIHYQIGDKRLEFSNAKLINNSLTATVRITLNA
jgi:methionyl-tRNA formyltransferase